MTTTVSKALQQFVAEENFYRAIRNNPTLDANNLSWDDVLDLIDKVDSDLSPENLTCDGEIPYAKVRSRAIYLNAILKELNEISDTYQVDFELNAEIDQELANNN